MAISNYDRVGKALELLKTGLQPYVEREMKAQHDQLWLQQARAAVAETQAHLFSGGGEPEWDAAALLAVMWNQWDGVFKKTLGRAERSLISELRDIRNKWAHQKPFSSDDAYRALDSAARLLSAVVAPPQVEELEKLKTDLLRVRFDEQVRSEKRRTAGTAIESQSDATLKPWREVVNPHKDVQSGNYNQAEFAADLWQVYLGEGSDEYRKPEEFFRRTYLTVSLKELLVGAVQRLAGKSGDPVVQLQTNFGGGKTHSMLALFHLFSDVPAQGLLGIDEVLAEAGVSKPVKVNRVVLVGNKISPGNPVTKSDGTVVRTLWGEMAWQLGFGRGGIKEAKKAFSRIAADDELSTSPGDVLRELMNEYGPSLILIDEWVAYARQLHDNRDLPGGDFETHFSFAQALTESAKSAKQCLLVISLPASDTTGSPHAIADDVEVGGTRGRQALDRLRNAVGHRRRKDAGDEEQNTSQEAKPAPMLIGFRAVYVFDHSQTEGADLPEFEHSISGEVGDQRERLIAFLDEQNIKLEYNEKIAPALGVSYGGRIALLPGQSKAEEFTTLVHETAHELLHKTERRTMTTATVRETEAEAVAFIVGQAIGLEMGTASSDYIQMYAGNAALLTESLEVIQRTSAVILGALSAEATEEINSQPTEAAA